MHNDPAPITTDFSEDLRYSYNLTADSLVLDCGGYEGNFARLINERYGCKVVIFEPVSQFANAICTSFSLENTSNITLVHAGVGSYDHDVEFGIHGDGTGLYASTVFEQEDLPRELVHIIRLSEWIGNQRIDLLKLNIEGMEYAVIADLMTNGTMKQIKNLQVQFHRRKESDDQLHAVMRTELLITHRLTHDFPFCWELFTLRNEH